MKQLKFPGVVIALAFAILTFGLVITIAGAVLLGTNSPSALGWIGTGLGVSAVGIGFIGMGQAYAASDLLQRD